MVKGYLEVVSNCDHCESKVLEVSVRVGVSLCWVCLGGTCESEREGEREEASFDESTFKGLTGTHRSGHKSI